MTTYCRENYRYTALFCEENIWWLANTLQHEGVSSRAMDVLFFSNDEKSILMLNQLVADPGQYNQWDYHVVLKIHDGGQPWVLDFDTRLGFQVEFNDYLQNSFPDQSMLPHQYRCQIRSIPAHDFLSHFYSDRSHMQGMIDDNQFPSYPVIRPERNIRPVTLAEYLDFQLDIAATKVVSV